MGDILARCSLSTRVLYFFKKLDQNEGHHLILLDLRNLFTLAGVILASCIVPRWCCHLYYGDHSFDNNHQMGRTPRSTPSFQHPPLKRMLHWPGLEPAPSDCRSDALPLRHSAKVTAKDERDVFSLFSQYSHSPPAPHATQET